MYLTRPDGRINFRNCLTEARAEIKHTKWFVAYYYNQTKRLTANQIYWRVDGIRCAVEDERERIAAEAAALSHAAE